MAKVNVPRSDTLEQWRQKSNTQGALLGDPSSLIATATLSYTAVPVDSTVGSPSLPATFDITNIGGVYSAVINNGGLGYPAAPFDLLINGSRVGGTDGTHDVTITVNAVGSGVITDVSASGSGAADIVSEYNVLLADHQALEVEVGSGTVLDTASANVIGAINEIHGEVNLNTADINTPTTGILDRLDTKDIEVGTIGSLNTTASNLVSAINEVKVTADDAQVEIGGNVATDYDGPQTTIIAALDNHYAELNQLDTFTGIDGGVLNTSATNLRAAINEIHGEVNSNDSDISSLQGRATTLETNQGTIGSLTTTATNLVLAINEVNANADEALDEIGGTNAFRMDVDYIGPQSDIITALNSLYNASNLATLDGEYFRLDGSSPMNAGQSIKVSNAGITSQDSQNLILNTLNASNVETARLTIADSTGNIGINKAPGTYKVDISGSINATTVYESGTSIVTKYATLAGTNAISADNTLTGTNAYTFPAGKSFSLGGTTIASDTLTVSEWVQDVVGAMVSGNTESGITVTYQDADGTIDFDVNDPTITLTGDVTGSATMTNLGNVSINTTFTGENIQDTIAPLITNGVHTGISTTYDDTNNRINFALTADPVISLSGDVSGSATMTNLTSANISVTVADNSHNHTTGNITGIQEYVEDVVGAMVDSNTESGITVTYDDDTGKLNFDVGDPTISLTGDVTGSATMTNLGNVSIATTLATENLQDAIAPLLTNGVHTGISTTYDDTNNRMNLALTADPTISLAGDLSGSVTLTNLATNTYTLTAAVANNSHSHLFANISDALESVQDIVGEMVNPTNTEAGITVTYNDTTGKLDFNVNDPTITLTGDVTGSATMTNLGSINITTSISNAATLYVYNLAGTQLFP